MAIKETEVLVNLNGNNIKFYENKGYEIPRHVDKKGRALVKIGTEILVKIEDLSVSSECLVTKICDICKCEIPKPQPYLWVIHYRKNTNGVDKCSVCAQRDSGIKNGMANESNCIAVTNPEFAQWFWNKEDTLIRTSNSNKRSDFKCPECGNKVENKAINNIFNRNKVPCPCNDKVSYPEKFMYSLLNQLNVNFKFHKMFDWSKNLETNNPRLSGTKIYDFYLIELNTIIETHGSQHFEKGFEHLGAMLLEEVQENDRIKEAFAKENEINNYITIDCRYSEMEFIRTNILKSQLNKLFELSKIDWLKCHEFACSSFVIKACELWNEGNRTGEIAEILKISDGVIRRYLRQGLKLGFCNYDPIEAMRNSALENSKIRIKPVVQLSLDGEFIAEWESATLASKELGLTSGNISSACGRGKKTTGGSIWMYKEEYSPIKAKEKAKKIAKFKGCTPIVRLSLDGKFIDEWESFKDASEKLGINRSVISEVCNGKKETAGGFKWMYKNYNSPIKTMEKPQKINFNDRKKTVVRLSLDGEFIDEWESAPEASDKLGICKTGISRVCRREGNTAGGFKWMYKADYEKQYPRKMG